MSFCNLSFCNFCKKFQKKLFKFPETAKMFGKTQYFFAEVEHIPAEAANINSTFYLKNEDPSKSRWHKSTYFKREGGQQKNSQLMKWIFQMNRPHSGK